MPTIEVSYKDLCNLIGKKLNREELEEALLYVKGEIDEWENEKEKTVACSRLRLLIPTGLTCGVQKVLPGK